MDGGELGGIVGVIKGEMIIENCKNESAIECPAGRAAGIACTWQAEGSINKCVNKGNVVSGQYAGGIVCSMLNGNTRIYASYNTGDVSGVKNVGGICGNSYNQYNCPERISNCYNAGNINGTENVGGILGLRKLSSGFIFV